MDDIDTRGSEQRICRIRVAHSRWRSTNQVTAAGRLAEACREMSESIITQSTEHGRTAQDGDADRCASYA